MSGRVPLFLSVAACGAPPQRPACLLAEAGRQAAARRRAEGRRRQRRGGSAKEELLPGCIEADVAAPAAAIEEEDGSVPRELAA